MWPRIPMHRLILIALIGSNLAARAEANEVVRVGAKAFTEQHILGEIVAQLLETHTDLKVERVFDLGGTGVAHQALLAGELDIYVEYTGTALVDILREPVISDAGAVFRRVARVYRERFDLIWLPPVGFNNTYTIAVRADQAEREGWTTISDLADKPNLAAGFTSEFIERDDGYPGLRKAYGLDFARVIDMDPGLMYQAVAAGQVDVICAFATDSRISEYGLRTLEDDRGFFPPYDAAPVVRGATLRAHPEIAEALAPLVKSIDDAAMRQLNAGVDIHHRRPSDVARAWVERTAPASADQIRPHRDNGGQGAAGFFSLLRQRRAELLRKTLEHLRLTAIAIVIALALGVPAGILIHRLPRLASPVLSVTEIVQTIPSLAMLAFLFAIYRVLGAAPAITALVLYSLLPIVLNTLTGLRSVPPETREAAIGLGMTGGQRLRIVELPLALPVLMAGVRTAAVWTIGIATLSTYIGAGGLGDFISRGLARNDPALTMLGAVPAALMAVVFSAAIRSIERALSWK